MDAYQYAKLGGHPPLADLSPGAAPYDDVIPFTDGHTVDQSKRFYSKLATPK